MIQRQIQAYTRVKANAGSRKERLTELMQRRSAKKWDPKKKAQMVRRLMTASEELDQSVDFLDQLNHRLEQITTQATPPIHIPFVPEPATSV